ncbi:MAG: B12-binding domain-containing protein, partial [Acidimicrobiia bacterium]|nr:B12-binding domain-containing protein [Acidimicrobiia bacterium]
MTMLRELYEAVLTGEDERAAELTRQGLDEGLTPQTLIDDAMIPAMGEAGRLFEIEEYFVPEL